MLFEFDPYGHANKTPRGALPAVVCGTVVLHRIQRHPAWSAAMATFYLSNYFLNNSLCPPTP